MNILFVSEDFYPLMEGGGHFVIWRLANGLTGRGHRVQVVTRRIAGSAEHEVVNGIDVYRPFPCGDGLIQRTWFSVRLYFYLRAFLKDRSIDVMYNHAYSVTMPSTLAASRHHIPAVTSVRALAGKTSFTFRSPVLAALYYATEKLIIRLGRHAVLQFPSEHSRRMAEPDTRTRSAVIYDPFDTDEIRRTLANTDVRKTRGLLGADKEDQLLLFVGSLSPLKNVTGLLGVLGNLKLRFKLVIIGEGPQRSKIEQKVAETGLRTRVSLLGQRPHDETLSAMASCDVLILPSHSEQFPNVVVEALMLGRPVIARKVGGVSEIESANLYLVDSVDQIPSLLENGIEPKEDKGILDRYSIDRTAGEFEGLFQSVVSQL